MTYEEKKKALKRLHEKQQNSGYITLACVIFALMMSSFTVSWTKTFFLWSGFNPTHGFFVVSLPIILPMVWWLFMTIRYERKIDKLIDES
ncbi:hypothetical protein phiOC_p385 [Ochrobactrum phage vB_OspM_OC]|nr:hypothetical protein phiOC_p385 [Ochrobactrum phage vB_OspM_OC]